MSETIRFGDIVRTKGMRSPSMLVIKLDLQADDTELAELLWFDANMNARQIAAADVGCSNWVNTVEANRPSHSPRLAVIDHGYLKD